MITRNELKKVTGDSIAVTDTMLSKINEWRQMLAGEAEWTDDYVKSLRLERGICREFANVVVNEMQSSVSVEKLDKIYKAATANLNENLQQGLGLGSMIIKPLGGSKVEYVTADRFIPLAFDDEDKLVKVCFIDRKQIEEDDIYYRFETHSLEKGVLTITHKAFHSTSQGTIGVPCALDSVEEWGAYPEEVSFAVDRPIYGYYKNPLPNDIDGSTCGVSIFESAKESICKADKQYGRLEWEFESGERAIHADAMALERAETGKFRLPKNNKRLYRGLNLDVGDGKELFDIYSPEFRDESLRKGLEEYKRAIEFNVGLAYGDLSTPQMVEKTAQEIITSKQRKYSTVTAIQSKLQTCLEGLVFGLAFMNRMVNSGYEFTCTFEDSILTTDKERRELDRQEVAMGAMMLWEYRAKWYGEDEETAKKMVEADTEVIE